MTEKYLTLQDLRELDRYPGLDYEKKVHFSPFSHRKIIHRDYHRNYSVTSYILMFFIFSFIGWLWEVLVYLVRDGVLVNRGTLMGPWLPIYGAGGVGAVLFLRKFVDHHVLTFFMVMGLCTVIEYFTAWYLETYKGLKYWDYTGYFGNIHGRVCLEGALIFGFAGCAGIYIMAPFFDDLIHKIPFKLRVVLCVLLALLFFGDLVYVKFNPHTGKNITEFSAVQEYEFADNNFIQPFFIENDKNSVLCES